MANACKTDDMLRKIAGHASSLVGIPTNRKEAAALLRDVEDLMERERRNRQ